MSEKEEYIDIKIKNSYSYNYIVEATRFINKNTNYIEIFKEYFLHNPILFTNYVKPEKYNLLMLLFIIENRINKLPTELWELIGDYVMYGKEYSIDVFPQFSLYAYYYEISKTNSISKDKDNIYYITNDFEIIDINLIKLRNFYYKETNFTFVGHKYCGMGNYISLCYDKYFHKFFFKYSGGANQFEQREKYFTNLNFKNHSDYEKYLLTFSQANTIMMKTFENDTTINIYDFILDDNLK